jgi:hypothetical protein
LEKEQMKREDLLKQMREAVGTKDPIEFFSQMVDAFWMLFDQIDLIKSELISVRFNSALAIQWEPKLASDMLAEQVNILRQDKETYFAELTALKKAFAEDKVTQSYQEFCKFWQDTLGWHPFLNYK